MNKISCAALALLLPLVAQAGDPPLARWSIQTELALDVSPGRRMAVDAAGDVFVAGKSADFANQCMIVEKRSGANGASLWRRQACGSLAFAQGLAVDAAGDVVVTGHLDNDMRTIKYAGSTGAVQWDKSFNGPASGYDEGRTVDAISGGDVIVAGVMEGNSRDGKVIRYRGSDGEIVWHATIDNGSDDDFYASAVLDDGTVAVATRSYVASLNRWSVAKLNPDGAQLWRTIFGTVEGFPSVLAIGDDGTVYAAGVFRPRAFDNDLTIIKLSSGNGEVAWQRAFSTLGNDHVSGMRIDSHGSLYVTGSIEGSMLTARLSTATGASLWESRSAGGIVGGESGHDLALDDQGNVLVTGPSYNLSVTRTVKYSAEGQRLWMRADELLPLRGNGHAVVARGSDIFVLGTSGESGQLARITKLAADITPPPANVHALWWAAPAGVQSGWGVNVAQQGAILFATWFTYDADGRALWFVAPNTRKVDGNLYTGPLYRTAGPAFNSVPFSPSQVVSTEVGTATFEFESGTVGLFRWVVNGRPENRPIVPQLFRNPPVCAATSSGPSTNYQDLWWAAPAGVESGWGINFTHQEDLLFATWFTYDVDGKPLWLVGPDVRRVPGTQKFSGSLYRTRGPAYFDPNFNPAQVTNEILGSMTVTFPDPGQGQFTYTVNGVTQSKNIVRQSFGDPPTVCR